MGPGDGSIVDRSWRRFLRKHRPSTSTSYDRRPRGRVQWPKLHFFSPGNFMRMESPRTSKMADGGVFSAP